MSYKRGGFIANFAPGERNSPPYTGNPLAVVFDAGGTTGYQPQGVNNPDGNVGSIPVMSITPAAAARLEGPQPGSN